MTNRSFRIGIAQPPVVIDSDAELNVARATKLVARAADMGGDLVLFPEGYPGPILRRPKDRYDARSRMASSAAERAIAVCWSRMELCDDGQYRLVVYVVDSDGAPVLRYERAHPASLPLHETQVSVAPGEELGFCVIGGIPMGIVVCSELWVPEPARVLAVRGAEVILSPAGGGFTTLTENWKIIARARAIENLAYVALTNNIWNGEMGAAMIAGPETVIATSGHEDLVMADLDLDRLRWLRDHDDSLEEPKPFASIPGLVRFRRPELYVDLVKPAGDSYDFFMDPILKEGKV